MQILLIGRAGRDHALAWKLSQSDHVDKVFVAPGNGGTSQLPKVENVSLPLMDLDGLCQFATEQRIDLTIVGPAAPLVGGIVDRFRAAGLKIVGPTQLAAQLEGSKAFAKHFMQRHAIPTPAAKIKVDGLTNGRGVLLPDTRPGAAEIAREILVAGRFGKAGRSVLIEERLEGPELSVLAFCDGSDLLLMPPTQGFKRGFDRNVGPNCGGMGAVSPAPAATPALMQQIETQILAPAIAGMAAEGMPFSGILTVDLLVTDRGPQALEFNCHFGDPEAQALLPLLQSDLLELLAACAGGSLKGLQPVWSPAASVAVVMASHGYPGEYVPGVEITGVADAEALGSTVFHAGTKILNGRLLTDGGRVLAVTATADTVSDAAGRAYRSVRTVRFNEAHFRTDIGARRRLRQRRDER